jgi:hypothetical protein
MSKLKNLTSTELSDTKNIVLGLENHERFVNLPLNKKDKYFQNPNDIIKFIKDVEKLIRTRKEYSGYIKYLKEKVGLHTCALYSDISDEQAIIEMHHGPIFTLFDIIEIQITYLSLNNMPINSCILAHNVLKDHYENIIQVVMLCKAAHVAVHNEGDVSRNKRRFFIPIERSWGNINEYIRKYHKAFSINHYDKLKRYITEYKAYDSDNRSSENELFINKITRWADILKEKWDL